VDRLDPAPLRIGLAAGGGVVPGGGGVLSGAGDGRVQRAEALGVRAAKERLFINAGGELRLALAQEIPRIPEEVIARVAVVRERRAVAKATARRAGAANARVCPPGCPRRSGNITRWTFQPRR
jgi:hypothetical protein